jgi:SAM-dependent methyltransferase
VLPAPLTSEALADAASEADPNSLAAAERLRTRHGAEIAAAALDQVALRRRAVTKFGDRALAMFFTRDGLEQATRPAVAAHHARRLVAAGAERVVDLGCGIGSDAIAFAEAGLQVIAVELDDRTAAVARANLGDRGQVITGDAEDVAEKLITDGDAVFLDPARRTTSGRVWRTRDFRPRWEFVLEMLNRAAVTGVKLGPALPHREIPTGAEAEWLTDHGETIEVCLWSGPGSEPGTKAALIMPDHRLVAAERKASRRPIGRYLYEPDGAVIRAGGIGVLAEQLSAGLVDQQIAYLTGDERIDTPYATAFEIAEVLPYKESALRTWIRDHDIGTLEIKKRGIDVDPAALRKRLKPKGRERATMIITRTPDGARVLVATRIGDPD